MARGGQVEKAQIHAKAWHHHMLKNVQNHEQVEALSNYAGNMSNMYQQMNQQRHMERASPAFAMPMARPPGSSGAAMLSAPIRSKQSDEMSSNVYSNSRITSNQFQKKKK